ncbi:hypothetical protein ACFLZN_01290 [Nanoarchaeota archaeon]
MIDWAAFIQIPFNTTEVVMDVITKTTLTEAIIGVITLTFLGSLFPKKKRGVEIFESAFSKFGRFLKRWALALVWWIVLVLYFTYGAALFGGVGTIHSNLISLFYFFPGFGVVLFFCILVLIIPLLLLGLGIGALLNKLFKSSELIPFSIAGVMIVAGIAAKIWGILIMINLLQVANNITLLPAVILTLTPVVLFIVIIVILFAKVMAMLHRTKDKIKEKGHKIRKKVARKKAPSKPTKVVKPKKTVKKVTKRKPTKKKVVKPEKKVKTKPVKAKRKK